LKIKEMATSNQDKAGNGKHEGGNGQVCLTLTSLNIKRLGQVNKGCPYSQQSE
jgi:hypothetical protein